jgi:phosphatidyl-myo-inositol dimannoside synthase
MRVGFVTPSARAVDGWGRYAIEVARASRDFGIEPVLVTAEPAVDPSLDALERHAVLPPLFGRRFATPRSLWSMRRVRRVLATCDVVHGVAEPYMPLLALACGRGQPYVQTAHGTWAVRPLTSPLRRAVAARALRRVDLLIAQSRYTSNAMAARVPLPPHRVLPGGVHVADFAAPSPVRLPAWASGGGPLVLTVAQIKKRKGIHVSLEAVAIVRRQHPALRMVVVGPFEPASPYVGALREQARRLGLDDAVQLVGEVPFAELVAWYQAADVFLLLPVHDNGAFEGLGLVYLEAAAAGLPAIGTDACGASEAVADGETGLLVPPGDAAAAAAALTRLLGDARVRAGMAAAARARAAAFSWTGLAESLAACYRGLQPRRRASRP